MKGLGLEDFRIYEDERPQEVSHFIGADAERELVVAVDMSGSMEPAMATCRDAVKRFLATVRPDRPRHAARLQRLRLHGGPPRGLRRRRACARSTGSRAWGSTAFHDAVLRGLDLLERHRGRRALVLFTDGEDMVSHATAAGRPARGSR